MGREIHRVPLDFVWPLHMVWKGYVNPYSSQECSACNGSGYNRETKQLSDDWYAHSGDRAARWCYKLTQDEVDALIANGRLWDFTRDFIPGRGWVDKDPVPFISAEMINAIARKRFIHDAINRNICVETRAKRLGVYGLCPACGGDGCVWFSERVRELSDKWYEEERYGPPTGEGWQVWEDVADGSPVSPVFATSDALVIWLVSEGYSEAAARGFIQQEWVPSAVFSPEHGLQRDIESAASSEEEA